MSISLNKTWWTLSVTQTSPANSVQCYSTHQKKPTEPYAVHNFICQLQLCMSKDTLYVNHFLCVHYSLMNIRCTHSPLDSSSRVQKEQYTAHPSCTERALHTTNFVGGKRHMHFHISFVEWAVCIKRLFCRKSPKYDAFGWREKPYALHNWHLVYDTSETFDQSFARTALSITHFVCRKSDNIYHTPLVRETSKIDHAPLLCKQPYKQFISWAERIPCIYAADTFNIPQVTLLTFLLQKDPSTVHISFAERAIIKKEP